MTVEQQFRNLRDNVEAMTQAPPSESITTSEGRDGWAKAMAFIWDGVLTAERIAKEQGL